MSTIRRVEPELKASGGAELEALFEAMSDVVLELDREGRYLKIAPTNPSLLYRPSEELVGKTLHEVFDEAQADEFLGHIRHTLKTRKTIDTEYSLEIEGRQVFFAASITPMSGETVLWVARDVTERKRAEKIHQQKDFYEALLNAHSDLGEGIIILEEGRIDYANKAFLEISGYTQEELLSLPSCFQLITDEEKASFEEYIHDWHIESK